MIAVVGLVRAQDSPKTPDTKTTDPQAEAQRQRRLAEGLREAKRMLLLMDKDNNGKISKQEFMTFMEAEFERMDVNKDGQLDVAELTKSPMRASPHGRAR